MTDRVCGGIRVLALAYAAGLAVVAPSHLPAQTPGPALWTVDTISSTILRESRTIFVSLPPEYSDKWEEAERFPVIIVLDAQAERRFPIAVALTRMLAAPLAPEMPPAIVIGVENTDRYRDMTLPPQQGSVGSETNAAGAPRFSRFLVEELLPSIRRKYRTDSLTVVFGHSLSGLFTAYLYGIAPAINAAVVLSPSLQWNGGVAYRQVRDGILSRAARGRLFIAASATEGRDIDSLTRQLAAELQKRPNRSTIIEYGHYARASHVNTWLQGMLDGLRFVFQPVSVAGHPLEHASDQAASDVLIGMYDQIRARYAAGSRELGIADRLPRVFSSNLGQYFLGAKRYAVAGHICRDVATSYPQYWPADECLGDADRGLGDRSAARQRYEAAIKAARAAGAESSVGSLQRKLASLQIPPR